MRSRTFTGIMTAIAYLNAARLGSLACTSMTRILTFSLGVVSSVAAENYGLTRDIMSDNCAL